MYTNISGPHSQAIGQAKWGPKRSSAPYQVAVLERPATACNLMSTLDSMICAARLIRSCCQHPLDELGGFEHVLCTRASRGFRSRLARNPPPALSSPGSADRRHGAGKSQLWRRKFIAGIRLRGLCHLCPAVDFVNPPDATALAVYNDCVPGSEKMPA